MSWLFRQNTKSETGNRIRCMYMVPDKSMVRVQARVVIESAVQWQQEEAEAEVRKQTAVTAGRVQKMVRTSWVGN